MTEGNTDKNIFFFSLNQALIINKLMPIKYKFENRSKILLKNEKDNKNSHKKQKVNSNELSILNYRSNDSSIHSIILKDKGGQIKNKQPKNSLGLERSERNSRNYENDLLITNEEETLNTSSCIILATNKINKLSPYNSITDNSVTVNISPYTLPSNIGTMKINAPPKFTSEFISNPTCNKDRTKTFSKKKKSLEKGKKSNTKTSKSFEKPKNIKTKKKNINTNQESTINIIQNEIEELKTKYSNLEKEFQSLQHIKTHKEFNGSVYKTTKKRPTPKSITEEEKLELASKINQLNLTQKKEMRSIIKNYITIFNDGQFQFNLNCIPKSDFVKLRNYVDKCLQNNNEKNKAFGLINVNTIEKLEEINNKKSPIESTTGSDTNIIQIAHQFVGVKRNYLLDESEISSSIESLSSSSTDSSS